MVRNRLIRSNVVGGFIKEKINMQPDKWWQKRPEFVILPMALILIFGLLLLVKMLWSHDEPRQGVVKESVTESPVEKWKTVELDGISYKTKADWKVKQAEVADEVAKDLKDGKVEYKTLDDLNKVLEASPCRLNLTGQKAQDYLNDGIKHLQIIATALENGC